MTEVFFCKDGSVILGGKLLSGEEFEKLTKLMPDKTWVGFAELKDEDIQNPVFDKQKYYNEMVEYKGKLLAK